MKKSKRSADWQDRDVEASEEMRLDLDEADEEDENDILELDDVLELPEEEAALDDERSAVDEDIDLNDLRLDFEVEEKGRSEDHLVDALIFDENKLQTAGPERSDAAVDTTAREEAESFSIGFDESSFLILDQEVKPASVGEAIELSADQAVAETAEAEPKPSIEDLVQQIETRLIEAVQQVVETRLPDLVRNLLREEIERVKKELEAD